MSKQITNMDYKKITKENILDGLFYATSKKYRMDDFKNIRLRDLDSESVSELFTILTINKEYPKINKRDYTNWNTLTQVLNGINKLVKEWNSNKDKSLDDDEYFEDDFEGSDFFSSDSNF